MLEQNSKSGCKNYRCACFKAQNLSACAFDNLQRVQSLSEARLQERIDLPCGHKEVPLKELLSMYFCKKCRVEYFFSFCFGEVMQDDTWHCRQCHICRDWREWHCSKCERCGRSYFET